MQDSMQCAACAQIMVAENFGSARVAVCAAGCQGLWLDGDQLARLDSAGKGAGPALTRALQQALGNDERRDPLNCPRCALALQRRPHELVPDVQIDVCTQCSGSFLDAGELARIRARQLTPAEREAIARRRSRSQQRSEQAQEATWPHAPFNLGDVAFEVLRILP